MRYRFKICYKGTNYAGWQRQPNAHTIQEVIESRLSSLFSQTVDIVGCGRTDSGVHASEYFFHCDLNENLSYTFNDLISKLNGMLPPDIAIQEIIEVDPSFHARFDAIRRRYTYHIHFSKNPFSIGQSYYCYYKQHLNLQAFNEVAQVLQNNEDFLIFSKAHSDVKTTKCKIYECFWLHFPEENRMVFNVTADRFLRGMIRLIVGCTINVARGKLSLDELNQAIKEKNSLKQNWSVPAEGLFLSKVIY